MARTPLIAGNWKMNLNHLEAIALVQKIAFSLPEKYFAHVDVTVLPPWYRRSPSRYRTSTSRRWMWRSSRRSPTSAVSRS